MSVPPLTCLARNHTRPSVQHLCFCVSHTHGPVGRVLRGCRLRGGWAHGLSEVPPLLAHVDCGVRVWCWARGVCHSLELLPGAAWQTGARRCHWATMHAATHVRPCMRRPMRRPMHAATHVRGQRCTGQQASLAAAACTPGCQRSRRGGALGSLSWPERLRVCVCKWLGRPSLLGPCLGLHPWGWPAGFPACGTCTLTGRGMMGH